MIPPSSYFDRSGSGAQYTHRALTVIDLRDPPHIQRYQHPALLDVLERSRILLSRPWVAEQFFRSFQQALPKVQRWRGLDKLGEICEAANILTLLEHAWPKIFITYKHTALCRLRPSGLFLDGSLVDKFEHETDADKLASFHLQFYVLLLHEMARYVALCLDENSLADNNRTCDRLRKRLETGLLGGDIMAKPNKLHSLRIFKDGKPCWIRYRKVAERFWLGREFRPLSQLEFVPDGDFGKQEFGEDGEARQPRPKPLQHIYGCCVHTDKHVY